MTQAEGMLQRWKWCHVQHRYLCHALDREISSIPANKKRKKNVARGEKKRNKRWQVRAKHTTTIRIRLRIKWHCNLMHGCTVHAERAARRQQLHVAPCSRVKPNGAVTTKVDIQNAPLCQLSYAESLIPSCIQLEFSGSARRQRTALYICHCEALRAHFEIRRWKKRFIFIF